MHFGTYMGVYWILKFILFPLGLSIPFLLFLFFGLTLGFPFMGYYYARTYRDKVCGGSIRFLQAWVFIVFMYMFAALLTAVAHYIYFRFIDHGLIVNTYMGMFDEFEKKLQDWLRSNGDLSVSGCIFWFLTMFSSSKLYRSSLPYSSSSSLSGTECNFVRFWVAAWRQKLPCAWNFKVS